ncbi:MAG TPA: hypothetical protein PLG02_03895 [Methylotenera sp.]|nr:hypothetical protein [Methylotenera sp.]
MNCPISQSLSDDNQQAEIHLKYRPKKAFLTAFLHASLFYALEALYIKASRALFFSRTKLTYFYRNAGLRKLSFFDALKSFKFCTFRQSSKFAD